MHPNDQAPPAQAPDTTTAEPMQPTNPGANEAPDAPKEAVPAAPDTQSTAETPPDVPPPDTTQPPAEPQTPEWFMKDKYKTVEDQAKSAFELQKKMGKYWGTPQDGYKVDAVEGIDSDDPLLAGLTPALKEMGISQDGFNHLVSKYMDANKQMMKALEDDLKQTLTATDAHTYQAINKWMTESLTPEEATQIKNNWLMTADDFKLFNSLRLMLAPSTNVPSGLTSPAKFESSKEVENDKITYRKELLAGTRVADKNYENELSGRFRDAKSRELRNKGR